MTQARLLPIKIVFPSPIDYQAPSAGFGKPTFFGEPSDELRKHFDAQVEAVRRYFSSAFTTWGDLPAIAKVKMKPEALAKSHRPNDLFNDSTCPVVGANRLGELLVSVSKDGLDRLTQKILSGQSQAMQANLTAIKEIMPYTSEDAIAATIDELVAEAADHDSPGLRYRLFRHPSEEVNRKIEAELKNIARHVGVKELKALNYGPDLRVFRVVAPNKAAVEALGAIVKSRG